MRQYNKSVYKRLHSFSLSYGFVPLGFPSQVFNEVVSPKRIEEQLYYFSLSLHFCPTGFYEARFLTRQFVSCKFATCIRILYPKGE